MLPRSLQFLWAFLVAVQSVASGTASPDSPPVYPATTHDPLDARVDAIVDALTTEDLLGHMTQVNIGSLLTGDELDERKVRAFAQARVGSFFDSPFGGGPRGRGKVGYNATEWRRLLTRLQELSMAENGGHPILYGLDSVHGAIYVLNATIFGQQINAGAAFNPLLTHAMGRITARDTLAAGVPWIFAPILEVSQNPLWARTYETFGEDPVLVSAMGEALIRGMQSTGRTAACMKHFIAYSKTATGHDRDPVTLTDFELLNYFAPPFLAAVNAGVKSAMENYVSINGVPMAASHKHLTRLLRHDMGFDGLLVTDWGEIYNLQQHHRLVRTQREAVALSLDQTSIDMSMVPNDTSFINHTRACLEDQPGRIDRIRASARRLVKLKVELGLYEDPVPGAEFVDLVGSAEDRNVALDLARESIVLLKNDGDLLPMPRNASVFLTGHAADNIGHLCGGWSVRWQGYSGNDNFPNGVSLRRGIETLSLNRSRVSYLAGVDVDGKYSDADLVKAKKMARAADYTIVAIGEGPYAEKPGDINDLALPWGQAQYVRELATTGAKLIVVLVGGRPRLLNGLPYVVPAMLNALLPGELGGQALAEILFGVVNPSGRLPITYPRDPAHVLIPYNHPVSVRCRDGPCQPEWDFGAGLSYTTFEYGNLTLSKRVVQGERDRVDVAVDVTNTGRRAGKEVVMLFLIQPYRVISITERKQLKKFRKIELAPRQSMRVTFSLTFQDWSVFRPQIGEGFRRVAEPGEFVVAIRPETDCDVYNDHKPNGSHPLCASFTLERDAVNGYCYV
ncbi:hypothetical protein PINS_up000379 [Pythium insidiosum]|nr:hypothetical protein PINS_up000379 [Pythium insidiosum]